MKMCYSVGSVPIKFCLAMHGAPVKRASEESGEKSERERDGSKV